MKDAIEEKNNGCIMHVKVKIGKRCRFPSGYDKWRNKIEIQVNEKPIEGKANKRIIQMTSKFFGLPENDISIIYGEKSREKGLYIKMKKEEVLRALNGL
ncbi:MAG: YggU family protein [Thermoplasmata archaeon]|nr:YggU family protein [Thermoplasmata archaeon]